MNNEIYLCVYKLKNGTKSLIDKLKCAIEKLLPRHTIKIWDITSSGRLNIQDSYVFVFGKVADQNTSSDNKIILPKPDNITSDNKREVWNYIVQQCDKIKNNINTTNDNTKELYIKNSDGYTIGLYGSNIKITEQELKYIQQIKSLVGAGSITLTKGDITVKLDPEQGI